MTDTIHYIWLNFIENIPLAKRRELINYFGGISSLYEAEKQDYLKLEGLSQAGISSLCKKNLSRAREEYEKASDLGVLLITRENPAYPQRLEEIFDPPLLLYAKGDVSLLKNELSFCIVGSREPSEYGSSAALGISSRLAECGFVIVSGCAMGIDSAAHKGALRVRGKTIGVMACGINVDYPAGNRPLRDDIEKNGLMISEFPLDAIALPGIFQRRNRVMSGLSLGTAVIEAGHRSGALITAHHALEQNRDVYAVPGNINSAGSGGTNRLIAEGSAAMLLDADMILDDYLVRYPYLFDKQTVHFDSEEAPEAVEKTAALFEDTQINEDEKAILRLLSTGEMPVDGIIAALGKPAAFVNSALSLMQIKGYIYEKPGRLYGKK